MKNVLILHGDGNNHTGNWFPWLNQELEKRGYSVWIPDLPDSDTPDKEKWISTIFSNKNWQFNEESIIVGHSAGATCILRILEKLPEGICIRKALLVAGVAMLGTKPEYFPYKESMVKGEFLWDKIKKACKQFYYICSDNDPYECGVDQSTIFQTHIGGEIMLRQGEGHFNLEKGPQYKKFPELLEMILE